MSREELFGGSYLGGKTSGGNCPGTTFIGEGGGNCSGSSCPGGVIQGNCLGGKSPGRREL